jgi:hypothetical protein
MGNAYVMVLAVAILVVAWVFVSLAVVVLCMAAHHGDLNERRRGRSTASVRRLRERATA